MDGSKYFHIVSGITSYEAIEPLICYTFKFSRAKSNKYRNHHVYISRTTVLNKYNLQTHYIAILKYLFTNWSVFSKLIINNLKMRKSFKSLKILFLTNAHNSMSQRALLELQKNKHNVQVRIINDSKEMTQAKKALNPDLIICPQLTSRVPEEVWSDKNTPCLIVHPGVQGDKGISSLDWALKTGKKQWGVTLLQAEEEMDAGDIWSTKNFSIERSDPVTLTKSSLYRHECVTAAMQCIHEAVNKFIDGIRPKKLEDTDPETIGRLRPAMKQKDRAISWNMGVDEIAHNIRFSDTQPGVKMELLGEEVFAYNAFPEKMNTPPGELGAAICTRHGAVAVRAKDGIIWLKTLKRKGGIKLPATHLLPSYAKLQEYTEHSTELPNFQSPLQRPKTFQDIWTCTNKQGVCYLHFDFPNGACSTDQLIRLKTTLMRIRHDPSIKVLLLMGGYDAFSCGINLNLIEHSLDPVEESHRNINAMNDAIRELFLMKDKLTLSVLQGGAGAGGVMQAIAADLVWTHGENILNPHYKLMGLSGSEYWTHFLPVRVGDEMSHKLTESLSPITAAYAKDINLIDGIIAKDVEGLRACLEEKVDELMADSNYVETVIKRKQMERNQEWINMVERKREIEMSKMAENFRTREYSNARSKFVRKFKADPPLLIFSRKEVSV